jgi:hypothetical protein
MKTIVATLVLAAALASPVLAQTAPTRQQDAQQYSGGFQGYPIGEWQRPDTW